MTAWQPRHPHLLLPTRRSLLSLSSPSAALTAGFCRTVHVLLLPLQVGCYLASSLISTQYGFRMARVQLHIKSAVISAVYTQARRHLLPPSHRQGMADAFASLRVPASPATCHNLTPPLCHDLPQR